MFGNVTPQELLLGFIALVPAFVLHELAHAWTAVKLGDPTPRSQGRLTLNPLKHLDFIGTLLLLTRGFGWARPVQVNPHNFRDPQRDNAIVAAAGPLTNLALALLAAIVLMRLRSPGIPEVAIQLALQFFSINVALFVFNLIPIPPLDGSRILAGVLPPRQAQAFDQLERYGWAILLLVMMFGAIDWVLTPLDQGVVTVLLRVAAVGVR
ncbi:MAG: site-2 protease family protein [Symbiobacteriia bacterium]